LRLKPAEGRAECCDADELQYAALCQQSDGHELYILEMPC
jgi:hypothetical protein